MKRILAASIRRLAFPTQGSPSRGLMVVTIFAISLLGLERGVGYLQALRVVGPEAYWIWLDDLPSETGEAIEKPAVDPRSIEPVAFFAGRDFELDDEAARAIGLGEARALLDIVADESYVAYLNGAWIGGNTFSPEQEVDRYEVGRWLREGTNRVLVELRSQRGVGGLLVGLRLDDADGERTVVTSDASWRIFHRFDDALFRPGPWPPGAASPKLWAKPPTGRWRPRPAEHERPIPYTIPGLGEPEQGPPRVAARRIRRLWGEDWIDIVRRRRRLPTLGQKLLFDWGREVSGYLFFDLPGRDHPPALAWFGDRPPDPFRRPPDDVLIFTPGLDQWRSIHPRRFRYLLLIGVAPERTIEVRRLTPELTDRLAPPTPPRGVFGIKPANRHTPAEERVWGRLREDPRETPSNNDP